MHWFRYESLFWSKNICPWRKISETRRKPDKQLNEDYWYQNRFCGSRSGPINVQIGPVTTIKPTSIEPVVSNGWVGLEVAFHAVGRVNTVRLCGVDCSTGPFLLNHTLPLPPTRTRSLRPTSHDRFFVLDLDPLMSSPALLTATDLLRTIVSSCPLHGPGGDPMLTAALCSCDKDRKIYSFWEFVFQSKSTAPARRLPTSNTLRHAESHGRAILAFWKERCCYVILSSCL